MNHSMIHQAIFPSRRSGVLLVAIGLLWLTLVAPAQAADLTPLCRFGIAGHQNLTDYPFEALRFGWYADWTATANPVRPGGMEYLPMVRFTQTGANSYSAYPTGSQLVDIINANPGYLWIVGNEPDRRFFQDSLEPAIYARAYHDLYYQIKTADPTARVAAGSIVQPTPLRLQYLDMVLASYRAQFGEPMPVDVWNMHAFILREMSCNHDPNNCWGADVPPGISAPYGMLYEIQDNDNIEIFKQFIVDFRQWMQARGYQDRPLIITEFGVLMPTDYGFTTDRVNAFMNQAFDYLRTASGPTGLASDDFRYVQQWAWYSLDDFTFNGALFDNQTDGITPIGQNFAQYTGNLASVVNLKPISGSLTTLRGVGGTYSSKLVARVVNSGDVQFTGPTVVRFYDGDPGAGGQQIAADVTISNIGGCASDAVTVVANITDPNRTGPFTVWVVVDPGNQVTEVREDDNVLRVRVIAGGAYLLLPRVTSSRF